MKSVINGETESLLGVNLRDNNGVEHLIDVRKSDGKITAHNQDGYPDDAEKRTKEGNEHVNQARRYAKYYVFAQHGYDTLPHVDNPAYVDAVRRAIGDLSETAFERYFGALYRQLRSHDDPSVDRPRDLPSAVRKPDAVVYEPEVYLGLEVVGEAITERAQALATAHGLDLDTDDEVQPATDLDDDTRQRWRAFEEGLADIVEREDADTELTITGVSGLHVGYPNRRGRHEVDEADTPFTHQAQARFSLLPYAPHTIAEFREYLDHHLRCQVRDRFVTMGVVPPEPYRVVGMGRFQDARRYDHYELYPQLHLADGDHSPLFG